MSVFNNNKPAETPMIQACWFAYDIPENADIEDPCDVLRPIGFHAQLSGWIIQEADIPYMYVAELERVGATVDIVRFDASEAPKLLRMACRAIAGGIKKAVANARANADTAYLKLQEGDSPDKDFQKYKNAQNRIMKTMGKKLKDYKAAAERFQLTAKIPSLSTCVGAMSAIRSTMLQRAKAYAEAVRELEGAVGASNAIVTTAKQSGIPGEILADYLDDNGLDGQALRSRFF